MMQSLSERGLAAVVLALALALGATPVAGQHEEHSPYAGAGSQQVQTLTADEVAALLEGQGMGLARAAELNGYPGPRHVLDLADSLGLTADQRERTQSAFDAMQSRAAELGRSILEREQALDAGFADGADAAALEAQVAEIARLRGELRWTHLRAHLAVATILTRHQRHTYDRLRGYGH